MSKQQVRLAIALTSGVVSAVKTIAIALEDLSPAEIQRIAEDVIKDYNAKSAMVTPIRLEDQF